MQISSDGKPIGWVRSRLLLSEICANGSDNPYSRQKRQSCHLIPTTNGFAGHPCDPHRHAAGLQIMRVSPRLARRSRYDSAKGRVSPSTRPDHLKVQARPIESVTSIIWSSKQTFRDPVWEAFADPLSATISIDNLPLQRPRLEVSYHRKR